ncbi:hypothetical protein F5148DRAFT_623765 [Russula earlei]|uniref:Uncharacterized protein n=1 Tax=Russula earlei TaxID=71964 RepID=A0ACC0UF03_9AGAM|nr:hypothetical protein F5148DRAFT_623765 [Russula earlei]
MTTTNPSIFGRVTINTLPDDVLVDIFHFYVNGWRIRTNVWYTLVHVCQRWRYVVFASPRHLNLQLRYGGERPMSEMLDIWSVLPVVIGPAIYSSSIWGNITAFLDSEHYHRICEIHLYCIPTSHWEIFAAAMEKPFPELTSLHIWVEGDTATSVPDPFLGGSAPLLQYLWLESCSFPGIPKLLSTSHHLCCLTLLDIPDSGYFSPQALVTALSVTSRLESLDLSFHSHRSRPDPASRLPPPLTRSVLPALYHLMFRGVHEYLEDLLAQIEAPLLGHLNVKFFADVNFVVPQLHQLISHTESFKACDKASVYASDRAVELAISREELYDSPDLSLEIMCRELDRQLSSLAQVCNSSLILLSTLVQLELDIVNRTSTWENDVENRSMAGTSRSVRFCKGSAPFQTSWATCLRSAGRARGRKSSRSLTRATEHFLGGPRAIGTCSEIY